MICYYCAKILNLKKCLFCITYMQLTGQISLGQYAFSTFFKCLILIILFTALITKYTNLSLHPKSDRLQEWAVMVLIPAESQMKMLPKVTTLCLALGKRTACLSYPCEETHPNWCVERDYVVITCFISSDYVVRTCFISSLKQVSVHQQACVKENIIC